MLESLSVFPTDYFFYWLYAYPENLLLFQYYNR